MAVRLPAGLELRPARAADTDQVLALIGAIFREYGCVLNVEQEDTHLLAPGSYFRRRGGEFWVVCAGETIVATVAWLPHGQTAELKCLYVASAWRRQGLGRRLTKLVIDVARSAGLRELHLWSDTRFTAAHGLYAGMGFERCGERDLQDSNETREYGFRMLLE